MNRSFSLTPSFTHPFIHFNNIYYPLITTNFDVRLWLDDNIDELHCHTLKQYFNSHGCS